MLWTSPQNLALQAAIHTTVPFCLCETTLLLAKQRAPLWQISSCDRGQRFYVFSESNYGKQSIQLNSLGRSTSVLSFGLAEQNNTCTSLSVPLLPEDGEKNSWITEVPSVQKCPVTVQNLHGWVFQPKWPHRPTWFPHEMTLWGEFFWLGSCCCCFVGSSDRYIYWSHFRHFYNQKYENKQKWGNFMQVSAIFIIRVSSSVPSCPAPRRGTSAPWNSSTMQPVSLPPLLTAVMETFL